METTNFKELLDARYQLFRAEIVRLEALVAKLERHQEEQDARLNTLINAHHEKNAVRGFVISLGNVIQWLIPLGVGAAIVSLWERFK